MAGIVDAATDSDSVDPAAKADWRLRKEAHIDHARHVDADAALVMACDKLHNLTATVADLDAQGERVFDSFKGGADGTRWYYRAMRDALAPRLPRALVDELDAQLAALRA